MYCPWDSAPISNANSSWLGAEVIEPEAGRGWLGDPQTKSQPSLTDMVDDALISEHEEFVDDSWVDEEILENELEEFPAAAEPPMPSPEIGGAFLKMLLVAVLVVLVGGGLLFVNTDKMTPEQVAAEQKSKLLQSAQAYTLDAEKELKTGYPELAVPQFEMALVNLAEAEASREDIDQLELRLCQAIIQAEEYAQSISHWKNLLQSPNLKIAEAARIGLGEAKKEKRREANALLVKAEEELAETGTHSPRNLAKDALELYKKFDGSRAQIADAQGVIGLSFINSKEYGSAERYLQSALNLEPALKSKYASQLARIRLQKVPVAANNPVANKVVVTPVFDPGAPEYVKSNHQATYRSSNGSTQKSDNTFVRNTPKGPKKMKEIAAHRSTQQKKQDRLGKKSVVRGYDE